MHAISAVLMSLGLAGCSSTDVASADQPPAEARQELPEYRKNPLLADFMDVCSVALRNAAEGAALAQINWKPAQVGDQNVFVRGNPHFEGFQLIIVPAADSIRAATCSIHGSYVSPSYAAYFDKLEIEGYQAETELGLGVERRLSGTASFGDPVSVRAAGSVAQGAATVMLTMTNLALSTDHPQ